ncbi:MAG: biopolymer transporter ExbD [Brachymonas sp.]|nr:biopolymer transporter ExbD [Brachymonas sp.]
MDDDIDEINIVPLLDIMLVLLTIVLTTATFVATGRIPVDLAKSRQAATTAQTESLVVTMTAERTFFLNDQPVPDLVAALAGKDRNTPVLMRADGKLALQEFVAAVDTVKQAGFTKVNLEVQRP